MTTVVTGATGHIGANLVRALKEQKRPVRCLIHESRRGIEGLDVETVRGDLLDLESLCRAFEGAEIVYHLAARISISNRDRAVLEDINVRGTANVVEACRRTGVRRLVHFSSIHALEREPLSSPVDESRALVTDGRCPSYDLSKAAGEKEVLRGIESGLDAVIILPTAVIGPHDFNLSHFGEALLYMACGKLPALVEGGYDWVDTRDVVAGAIKAEERAPTGERYLLSGHWVSLCDVAGMVAEFTDVPRARLVCPLWLARLGAPVLSGISRFSGKRPLYTSVSLDALRSSRQINHDKATRELDYRPRPFRETLRDTLRWYAENGYFLREKVIKPAESS